MRFEREPLHGFVQSPGFASADGVDCLSPDGNLLKLPFREIKAICFVQDFDDPLPRLDGAQFVSRPKKAGLWVRMKFRDGVSMDGLLTSQLLQLDPFGFMVMPPDQAVNPQWVYVPRAALMEMMVLAVVGSGLKSATKAAKPSPDAQARLF